MQILCETSLFSMTAFPLPQLRLMDAAAPLSLSQSILQLMAINLQVSGRHHIPSDVPLLIVSNHRSALDGPVLMQGLQRNIAFVCHQYMANVPVLRDVVSRFGAFPLDSPHRFFREGYRRLRQSQAIGIFPEGAQPMVQLQLPRHVNPFHRGFAHLALRAPVETLAILPVALISDEKGFESPIPLSLLSWFDPTEPLFQKGGGHPIVIYQNVEVSIGAPIWVTPRDRRRYQGNQGIDYAQQLTDDCWQAVHDLLQAPSPH
jgi:1-acyl-sn-glycerol-3-phosphate acyltransferase